MIPNNTEAQSWRLWKALAPTAVPEYLCCLYQAKQQQQQNKQQKKPHYYFIILSGPDLNLSNGIKIVWDIPRFPPILLLMSEF